MDCSQSDHIWGVRGLHTKVKQAPETQATKARKKQPQEGPLVNGSSGNETKPILEQIFLLNIFILQPTDSVEEKLFLRVAKGQNQGKKFKVFPR